jgi:hypothetical protein
MAALLVAPVVAWAHDVPADVLVQAFVKPSGERLQLAMRVPLKALRDVNFPEQAEGYLDVERLMPLLPDAAKLWLSDVIDVYEGESMLPRPQVKALQLSIESDRSFASLEEAMARIHAPKPGNADRLVWHQVYFDVLLEYPIRSDQSAFAIHPRLDHLATRVVTVLRFVPPGGQPERAYQFNSDPGRVPLDPSWSQAALRFVALGFRHILEGTDHILFLLCLVLPFRRLRALVVVITAFTVAHSITLIAAAYRLGPDALWFPPLIETLIAASIVYMALENIVGVTATGRRWILAFAFGLVHGFGFSFLLQQTLQFAGSHLLLSLVSFNVGVELGQLLILLLLIPLLEGLFRFVVAERMGIIIGSVVVAHTAWHWMEERGQRLLQFDFSWPVADAAGIALAMRWAAALLVAGGLGWWGMRALRRRERIGSSEPSSQP